MSTIVGEEMPVLGRHLKRGTALASPGTRRADGPFHDLFERHWPRVLAVATRLLGDADEAEDLALDVFNQLHQRQPHTENEAQLAGWLYRVTTNAGLNALRASRRRRHYEARAGRQALEPLSSPIGAPAEMLERRERREAVRRTLGAISPRAAQLLILRQAGLSYAELAAANGVATGSIGTLLARAEREFAAHFDRDEGG